MKNDEQFDLVLDANDPNFADKLAQALGVGKGGEIEITTPVHNRTDGVIVSYLPNTLQEYQKMHELSEETLLKIGCQLWDEEGGVRHWLYPKEWFNYIPDGFEVYDICGKVHMFNRSNFSDDARYGALAFGFMQTTSKGE